ncbi:endonuclease NucS domain-containing protein [Granulicella aggregans]|uniref:endonuclease NucS domain-containing protein n=1 Tax=Granulicella aggregans TaxID=474949 RepID=UPI001FECBC6D|nr:endonuclease NucS domain-containing protein [Granulicella aggregans]
MPVEMKIWKIEDKPRELVFEPMESEAKLEKLLVQDISILSTQLLLVGSQVPTSFGKFIDLLALDSEGNVVVIELKRRKTPRDAVAQLLDYASWAKTLTYIDLQHLFADGDATRDLSRDYAAFLGTAAPEELSGQLRLLLVAAALDSESERIMNFLSEDYGVPINAVFFRYFQDGASQFITRSWLIDPSEVEVNTAKASAARSQDIWNGNDFYVAFGEDQHRNWQDAVKFGFVSAGGGTHYSGRLRNLFVGARIFAYIPGRGYVGVGVVTGGVLSLNEFRVERDGEEVPLLEAGANGKYLAEYANDPDMSEYFVPVQWTTTVPVEKAFREPGLYANQGIVTKMKSQTTLTALKKRFSLET